MMGIYVMLTDKNSINERYLILSFICIVLL